MAKNLSKNSSKKCVYPDQAHVNQHKVMATTGKLPQAPKSGGSKSPKK